MPFGDGTGPLGQGPRTGRGWGFCSGYPCPGYLNSGVRGWGRRFGYGWRRGRGRGWSIPWQIPWQGSQDIEEEKEALNEELKILKDEMKTIEKRLKELEVQEGQTRKTK